MKRCNLTPPEAARLSGSSATRWRAICATVPGFALRVSRSFEIPESHFYRVMAGESPHAIGAEALERLKRAQGQPESIATAH